MLLLQLSILMLLISLTACQTSDAPCQDDPLADCHAYAGLCSNPMYTSFLDKYCPKTCGLCPDSTTLVPPTANPNCVDTNVHCKSWAKQGYCTSCFLDCAEKIQNCAKSCGFCNPEACLNCKQREKLPSNNFRN
ncbi:ShKT domain-containing protein [Caenorhabditis elegans]|uniref:ShKT domain-containing protein n=1 Tax=Caenorhabditis elegans TaxID=6239 RepID=Q9XVB0_CAEEL|nr:ShKT domain-containing protein [Caenorhabditis elegans]CAB04040.1 ShKT domain-containing protein [Caenorhabditis elegans]|eukprot:NP_496933.1 Uncharacterized protein CELE_F01D5.2 [Caenorhabditis elegans]